MPDKTEVQTEIDLLAALERGEVVTQMALSKRLSVSVGLVNALLKRVVQKGWVKAKAAPYKRWAYYVTPGGFAEKSRLVASYLEISLDFFRKARGEYSELFGRARSRGVKRIVLVGGGELAEIALLAARDIDIEIIGLFDRTTNAEKLYGLTVLRNLDDVGASAALVITDSRHPQEAYENIRGVLHGREVLVPALLRVTLSRSDEVGTEQ